MQMIFKFILLCAYLLLCVFLAILVWWSGNFMCLRDECITHSKFTILKMNPKANPCNDFYDFVCGKALQVPKVSNNATPKQKVLKVIQRRRKTIKSNNVSDYIDHSKSYFKIVNDEINDYLQTIKAAFYYDFPKNYHELLVGMFMGFCNSVPNNYRNDMPGLKTFKFLFRESFFGTGMSLRDIFNPKKFNQSLSAGIYEYRLRMVGFLGQHYFKSDIKRDHNEPSSGKKTLYIEKGEPNFSIADSELIVKYTREETKQFWVRLFRELTISMFIFREGEEVGTDETLGNVIDLLLDIRDARKTEEGVQTSFEMIPLDKLQEQFPDLDFKGFLQEIIKDNKKIPTYIYMAVKSKSYFAALRNVLSKPGYTRQSKVLLQVFHCLFEYFPILPIPIRIVRRLPDLASAKLSSNEYCRKCIGSSLPGMMLSLIIERFKIRGNAKDSINNILANLKKVFEISIQQSSWMDKNTKTKGIKKLKAIKELISISNMKFKTMNSAGKRQQYFNGLCLVKGYLTTIMCINRFFSRKYFSLFRREISGFDETKTFISRSILYTRNMNELSVPIQVLRKPMFEESWPWSVNYGIIGTEIGLSLTQGFDEGGSKMDESGKDKTWWTNTTYKNFKKLDASCSSLSSKAFARKSWGSTNDTDARSLIMKYATGDENEYGRNWEYVTSVRLAYRAYVEHTKRNKYKESLLPGLEDYSPEKLLFLSHVRMYCPRSDDTDEITLGTKHYFEAISSLTEFKEAFSCSKRDSSVSKTVNKCMLF